MSFMLRHTRFVLVGMTFTALSTCPTQTHNTGVSTSRIVIHGRTVGVEINALGRDYEQAAGVPDVASGVVNLMALSVMAPPLLTYVGDHVAVLADSRHCASRLGTVHAADTRLIIATCAIV